jgi:extracellular elastinolytic metalloproteinase
MQTPLDTAIPEDGLDPLSHLLESNCAYEADAPTPEVLSANVDDSMLQALLRFMLAASPDTALAEDIRANFLVHRRNMAATPSAQVLGTGGNHHEVENVPGAVSPVKARLAYVQVPQDGTTVLSLVWKVSSLRSHAWARSC